jgi:hypothetical protein
MKKMNFDKILNNLYVYAKNIFVKNLQKPIGINEDVEDVLTTIQLLISENVACEVGITDIKISSEYYYIDAYNNRAFKIIFVRDRVFNDSILLPSECLVLFNLDGKFVSFAIIGNIVAEHYRHNYIKKISKKKCIKMLSEKLANHMNEVFGSKYSYRCEKNEKI